MGFPRVIRLSSKRDATQDDLIFGVEIIGVVVVDLDSDDFMELE